MMKDIKLLFVLHLFAEIVDWSGPIKFWRLTWCRRLGFRRKVSTPRYRTFRSSNYHNSSCTELRATSTSALSTRVHALTCGCPSRPRHLSANEPPATWRISTTLDCFSQWRLVVHHLVWREPLTVSGEPFRASLPTPERTEPELESS